MKMNITIRFYEELNNYLNADIRKQDIFIETKEGSSVGDIIGLFGVPCSVVDLILVNGQSSNFDYILQEKDHVSIYPVFERFNIESISMIKHSPLRKIKFLCDVHLGRLAKYLRMLGFDTFYKNAYDQNMLFKLLNEDKRILLSQDKKILLCKKIIRRYRIKQTGSGEQLREVISYFDLKNHIVPMSRCLECNGIVKAVPKEAVKHRIDRYTYDTNDEFTECTDCRKVFWKGSHYNSMMKQIRKIMD